MIVRDFNRQAKVFVRNCGFLSSILPYTDAGWEKLSIYLTLLVPKLPAPIEEDLSKASSRPSTWTATGQRAFERGVHRPLDHALRGFVAVTEREHSGLAQRFLELA